MLVLKRQAQFSMLYTEGCCEVDIKLINTDTGNWVASNLTHTQGVECYIDKFTITVIYLIFEITLLHTNSFVS